jgi:hypothetical protein
MMGDGEKRQVIIKLALDEENCNQSNHNGSSIKNTANAMENKIFTR